MVGQPFQLEGDATQRLGADGDLAAGQGLDRLAVGRGVADRGVARHRLHQVDRPLVRAADQGPLDAAMLVAERDLQVKDLLAVALEAEMPGSMTPAWTGPTATSWISSPSTR